MLKKSNHPFFKPVIQPKLTINQPNDFYEQKADAMAEKVMSMTEQNFVQRKEADSNGQEQLQRKTEEEDEQILLKRNATTSFLCPCWSSYS